MFVLYSQLNLEVCPSILVTSCKIILLRCGNKCKVETVYTTSCIILKIFNTIIVPSDLEWATQRISRTATSGIPDHTLQTTDPVLLFSSRYNCPICPVFPVTVREQECTFPTVIQYFTYSTILHGCKIWTIKQMRYKKSKDGRDIFMGRTAGYTLLHHRKQ